MAYKGLYGFKQFMWHVLGLVSRHASAPTHVIIGQMEKQNVVAYVAKHYPFGSNYRPEAGVYDIAAWEKAFFDRCHYRSAQDLQQKFNIHSDQDGLLLLLSYGMDYLNEPL